MTKDEALRMCIEALETPDRGLTGSVLKTKALAAARAAPAEQPAVPVVHAVKCNPADYCAARHTPLYTIPPGCVVVPVEPTEEMVAAGRGNFEKWGSVQRGWRDMLAARPGAPK